MAMIKNATPHCISIDVPLHRSSGETSVYFGGFFYFYIVIATVSTILNAMILCVLLFSKTLHGAFYLILGSLFASDFITGSVIFPLLAALNATMQKPNCFVLNVCLYFVHTISLVSILSMMAIAYDRYLRVAKRHSYGIFMTKTKGYVIVVSIWLSAILLGVLNAVVFSKVVAATAVGVICIILYLYIRTLKKLRTNVNQVTVNIFVQQPSHRDGGIKRSERLIFILIFTLVLLWCPSIAVSIMNDRVLYSPNENIFIALQQLPLLSAVSSPFLYFWTNRTTRRILMDICLKIFCNKVQADNETPAT